MSFAPSSTADARPKISPRPAASRLLPQAPDAERGMLSSFFIAPVEIGALCQGRGVTREHFHLPAHAELYSLLLEEWSQGRPVDFITVTQLLRDRGQLEEVGGAAYVTELFTYLPTAANAEYYRAILEEKRALRQVIQACTGFAARCHERQEDIPGLLREVGETIGGIARHHATAGLREKLSHLAFDLEHRPPRPVPIVRLGEWTIGTPGNLLVVQAQAKAGKSAALQGMMAATMNPTGDCLGFSSANPQGHALLHLDTEQCDADHDDACRRVLQRAGRAEKPDWFVSYRVTVLTIAERFEVLRLELARLRAKHGGILAVILDGAADLGHDPNDTKEAFAMVDELHRLAVAYHTLIVCVLHENPGTEIAKTRGHLGSQLERKAETNLRLEKDGEGVTVMFTLRARHAHIRKANGLRFVWSDEASMHVSTEAPFNAKAKAGRFASTHTRDQILEALSAIDGKKPTELRKEMDENLGMSKATFYRFVAELKTKGLVIEKTGLLFRAPGTNRCGT